VVNNPVSQDSGFGRKAVLAGVISRRVGAAAPALSEWNKDRLADAVAAEVQALLSE
jgi:hypothetical protein